MVGIGISQLRPRAEHYDLIPDSEQPYAYITGYKMGKLVATEPA